MYKIKLHSILVISLVVLFSQSLFAQDANALFVKGNELYLAEKYEDAIAHYLKAEIITKDSAELYFNIGNSYYNLNKVAPSIYFFEKAKRLSPNNVEIENNLSFANKMTLDNIQPLPLTFLQKLDKKTIQKLDYNTWAYVAITLLFLFSLLFLLYRFTESSGKKRMYFLTSITCLIIGLMAVLFAYHVFNLDDKDREAIIFSTQSKVKKAPTLTADEVFVLHEGTKVAILEEKDSWTKIKLIDGQTGWIYSSDAREL